MKGSLFQDVWYIEQEGPPDGKRFNLNGKTDEGKHRSVFESCVISLAFA